MIEEYQNFNIYFNVSMVYRSPGMIMLTKHHFPKICVLWIHVFAFQWCTCTYKFAWIVVHISCVYSVLRFTCVVTSMYFLEQFWVKFLPNLISSLFMSRVPLSLKNTSLVLLHVIIKIRLQLLNIMYKVKASHSAQWA